MTETLCETNFKGLGKVKRGKVRDVYTFKETLLIVTTDRLSAFDAILPDGIPGKGVILNQISNFWFEKFEDIIPNHILLKEAADFPIAHGTYDEQLKSRSVIVKKVEPLPIECIVRGYITGSGWKSYQENGKICGLYISSELVESQKFPKPIYTPSTKAEQGQHDENISYEKSIMIIQDWLSVKFNSCFDNPEINLTVAAIDIAKKAKNLSLELYKNGAKFALEKGIIIADTKFEFGVEFGEETGLFNLILIDEVLTPDSSRFWPLDDYEPGRSQNSFDKQIVRDYLTKELKWNKKPPAPKLPEEIIFKTAEKYQEIYKRLTTV